MSLPELASVGGTLCCAASFTFWSAPVAIQMLDTHEVTEQRSTASSSQLLEEGDRELGFATEMAEWGVPWVEYRRQMSEMDQQIKQQADVITELRTASLKHAQLQAELEEERDTLSAVAADRLEWFGESEKRMQDLEKVLSDSVVAHDSELIDLRAFLASTCAKAAEVDELHQALSVALFELDATQNEVERLKRECATLCDELANTRADRYVAWSEIKELKEQVAKLESDLRDRDAQLAVVQPESQAQSMTDAEAVQRSGSDKLFLRLASFTAEPTDPFGEVVTDPVVVTGTGSFGMPNQHLEDDIVDTTGQSPSSASSLLD
uniref:Uncharacterized protein n=1 Tax=Spumella elongata TaxID=89044 RepID=A0A7S3M0J0_9STRA